jgi:hypothetical protein
VQNRVQFFDLLALADEKSGDCREIATRVGAVVCAVAANPGSQISKPASVAITGQRVMQRVGARSGAADKSSLLKTGLTVAVALRTTYRLLLLQRHLRFTTIVMASSQGQISTAITPETEAQSRAGFPPFAKNSAGHAAGPADSEKR